MKGPFSGSLFLARKRSLLSEDPVGNCTRSWHGNGPKRFEAYHSPPQLGISSLDRKSTSPSSPRFLLNSSGECATLQLGNMMAAASPFICV